MSPTTKALVMGAGVAGSVFAKLYRDSVVYELFRVPIKPCGEAVPASVVHRGLPEGPSVVPLIRDYVVHEIRAMSVCVRDRCRTVDFGKTVGYIIDKRGWLTALRRSLEEWQRIRYTRAGRAVLESVAAEGWTIVDARGPYSNSPEYDRLTTARGFTDDFDGDTDTLYFYFHPGFMGYLWVFPSARQDMGAWNIGVGMRSEDYLRIGKQIDVILRELAEEMAWVRGEEIRHMRFMKIKVADPENAIAGNVVRIGEAGGFVVPFTGEGIRPAIESAKALALDLVYGDDMKRLRRLIKRYKRHHRIYRFLLKLGPERAARMLLKLEPEDFIALLEGELNILRTLRMMLRLL